MEQRSVFRIRIESRLPNVPFAPGREHAGAGSERRRVAPKSKGSPKGASTSLAAPETQLVGAGHARDRHTTWSLSRPTEKAALCAGSLLHNGSNGVRFACRSNASAAFVTIKEPLSVRPVSSRPMRHVAQEVV